MKTKTKKISTPKQIALAMAEIADDKKACDVVIQDLRKLTDFADYFVICHGTSDTHVRSIADAITATLKQRGQALTHSEGHDSRNWILLDYTHVVCHVFLEEARDFYALERLWGDAPLVKTA